MRLCREEAASPRAEAASVPAAGEGLPCARAPSSQGGDRCLRPARPAEPSAAAPHQTGHILVSRKQHVEALLGCLGDEEELHSEVRGGIQQQGPAGDSPFLAEVHWVRCCCLNSAGGTPGEGL